MEFRSPYDDSINVRHGDIHFGDEPSLTVQSAAAECDINLIIDRARRGVVPSFNGRQPTFGDFSEIGDYQSSLNSVLAAQEMFDAMPAAIRERFANEPAQLLAFVADDRNREEAIKLGIVAAPAVETPPASRSEPASETSSAGVAAGAGSA